MGTVLNRAALARRGWRRSGHVALRGRASDRHQWQVEIDAGYVAADSDLGPWTEGGLGKLRYAESNDGLISARLFRRVSRPDLADAARPPSSATTSTTRRSGVDLSEAFIDWRPIPKSSNQQQVRFGAFYPPLLARERRSRLEQPVHLFVLRDQHLARRGNSTDRRRMVAAAPARLRRLAARAARVRVGVLRQRPRRNLAVLARLVPA